MVHAVIMATIIKNRSRNNPIIRLQVTLVEWGSSYHLVFGNNFFADIKLTRLKFFHIQQDNQQQSHFTCFGYMLHTRDSILTGYLPLGLLI